MDTNTWDRVQLECPITHQFAIEPVQDPHGHIFEFENEAILNWLRVCNQSLFNRSFVGLYSRGWFLSLSIDLKSLQIFSALLMSAVALTGLF